MIARQAAIYRVDPDLVWSIIYEETYFSPWKVRDGEIGLMQVMPATAREWATETGMKELERQMASDPQSILRDPERNIQIGCWYLEKMYEQFQDEPKPRREWLLLTMLKPRGRVEPARPARQHAIGSGVYQPHRHSLDQSLRAFDHATLPAAQELQNFERRCSRLRLSNDDHLHGALGTSCVAPPIEHGAVVVEGERIAAVGSRAEIVERFPESKLESFGEAVILPGLINTHTHLELTALRGYLENEERDFFAWLRKLTVARLKLLTPDDIRVSATWGVRRFEQA